MVAANYPGSGVDEVQHIAPFLEQKQSKRTRPTTKNLECCFRREEGAAARFLVKQHRRGTALINTAPIPIRHSAGTKIPMLCTASIAAQREQPQQMTIRIKGMKCKGQRQLQRCILLCLLIASIIVQFIYFFNTHSDPKSVWPLAFKQSFHSP